MRTVHYDPSKPTFIKVGKPAAVYPLDHPSPFVSNMTVAHTTRVTSYNPETGVFVTRNTKYVPKEPDSQSSDGSKPFINI